MRTHSTKNGTIHKEPWTLPYRYNVAVSDAIRLRYALFPYIYHAARIAYDSGVSICRPMYYDYPDSAISYSCKNQYMFGDAMIVAPVTTPSKNGVSACRVWLPQGTWVEWFTGYVLQGGQSYERKFLTDEIPVYVKAGSVISMQQPVKHLGSATPHYLLKIFPYGDGTTSLYEDDGSTDGYQKGQFAFTKITSAYHKNDWEVTVNPLSGPPVFRLTSKQLELQFCGYWKPSGVSVNGRKISMERDSSKLFWSFDAQGCITHIFVPALTLEKATNVRLEFSPQAYQSKGILDGLSGKINRLREALALIKTNWSDGAPLPRILTSTESIMAKINYHSEADVFGSIAQFVKNYSLLPGEIQKLSFVNKQTIEDVLLLLGDSGTKISNSVILNND
jgi:hypothetical protein